MEDYHTPSASGPESLSTPKSAQSRIVKRPRPVKSCLECRRRKLKCDRLLPCSQCQKSQRGCRYAVDGDGGTPSDGSDGEAADRTVKRNRGPLLLDNGHGGSVVLPADCSILEDHTSRIERLEQMMLDKHSPPADGSTSGSSASPFPAASALNMQRLSIKGSRSRLFGPGSTRVILNLFDEAKDVIFNEDDSSDIRQSFKIIYNFHKAMKDGNQKAAAPIGVFVDSMTPVQKRMTDILPSKSACDQLMHIYMTQSETLYRVLHIPTFMSQYNQYWAGSPQAPAFLPQLLCVLCIGYRLFGIGKGRFQNERDGIHMPTACALVRTWLDGLRGKELVEFNTLQTEILVLMAQRVLSIQNQESWTHLGLIVRMAMTMGLHRDPSEFNESIAPFWAEQRRRLWTTILELDVFMSIQCNLPSCVRAGDYTCQSPRNINDEELYLNMTELPPSKPIEIDTDSRIQVFAASSLIARCKAVEVVSRIHSLRDYQQVLAIGSELERALEDVRFVVPPRHLATPNEVLRQWTTSTTLDMNCRRTLLALYRPFALAESDAPQQIMTGYLRSSVMLLSYLDQLDPSSPDYKSIWHVHHTVLRRDIFQASFAVCYYMKHINRTAFGIGDASNDPTANSDSTIEACVAASRSTVMLSPPRLQNAIERVIDVMIQRIGEIGMDLKDLLSLMIVFHTSQGGTKEQKQEAIRQAMQRFLEAGLKSIQLTQQDIEPIPPAMTPPGTMQLNSNQPPTSFSVNTYSDMMFSELQTLPGDFEITDSEFWSLFTPV
ncbi:hypothetical protein F5Y16DRAFT_340100 [Xylariaceae sp. FL0255]|nr:hypothetical protein F5Y16DRAFT_340100 [Xylariaceae sp. FL0255]